MHFSNELGFPWGARRRGRGPRRAASYDRAIITIASLDIRRPGSASSSPARGLSSRCAGAARPSPSRSCWRGRGRSLPLRQCVPVRLRPDDRAGLGMLRCPGRSGAGPLVLGRRHDGRLGAARSAEEYTRHPRHRGGRLGVRHSPAHRRLSGPTRHRTKQGQHQAAY